MKRSVNIAFISAIILLSVICIYASFLPYNEKNDTRGGIEDFSQGWVESDSGQEISLDGSRYSDGVTEVSLIKKLPDTLPRDAVLYMRSAHNEVSCFIDGKELFCEGVCLNRTFGIDYAGIWITIPISDEYAGKTITLDIKQSDGNEGKLPNETVLANRNALTSDLANHSAVLIFMAFVMILLSYAMLISTIILRNRLKSSLNSSIAWLALFMLTAGIWMLMDDNVPALFAQYNDAFYFLSFYSFMLMPVPFSYFIKSYIPKSEKAMNILAAGFLSSFFLSVIAAVFFRKPLSLMLPITHILIIIGLVITIAYALNDKDKNGHVRLKELFIGLCFLISAVIAALVCFYLGEIRLYAILFKTALLLFVLSLSYGTLDRAVAEIDRAKDFEKLAQTIPCGICRLNCLNGFTITYGNERYYNMFGYTSEEAHSLGFNEFDYILFQDDRERLRNMLTDYVNRKEKNFDIEVRALHKSGALMYILTSNNYLINNGEIVSSLTDITIRRNMEEQLRIRELDFRIAAEQSEKYIMRYEIKTGRLHAHSKAVHQFGINETSEDAVNSLIAYNFINPSSIDTHLKLFEKINRGEKTGYAVLQLYSKAMLMYRWYHIDFTTVFNNNGVAEQAIISFYDITEQREKELAYERLRLDAQSVPQEQVSTFECNLTHDEIANTTGTLIDGLADRKSFNERTFEYSELTHPDERQQVVQLMNRDYLISSFHNGIYSHSLEFRMMIGNSYRWLLLSVQILKYSDNNDLKAFVVVRDIDKKKTAELALIQRSETDGLTGILNRVAFVSSIDNLIARTSSEQHTLVMMDVDHFKDVNDTLGHDMGDKVLQNVASDLRKTLREGDILGRMGGDEFAFCFVNLSDDNVLINLLERVRNTLNHDIGQGIYQSVSMGAASFSGDASDFTEVYKMADAALYHAKRAGRNRFARYDEAMI